MKKESQSTNTPAIKPLDPTPESPFFRGLRDSMSVGGTVMESLSPNLKELMNNLRGVDNKVRDLADGKGVSGEDKALSLKELLNASKKSLRDAKYLQSIGYLGSFYNRLEDISKYFATIKGMAEKEHLDFLSKGLDEQGKKYLDSLHARHVKACSNIGMNKFGGLFNLFSGLKRWEKLNPSFTKELKNSISDHVRAAERVYNTFKTVFSEMNKFRYSRKIEGYIKNIDKISSVYIPAKVAFENFYKTKIKGYVDRINEANKAAEDEIKAQIEADKNKSTEESGKPAEELTVTEDSPNTEVPVAATETPIQKAYPNWGRAVPVSNETTAEPEFEEDFEEDVESEPEVPVVQEPVKTQPMPAVPELEVPVRQPVKEEVKTEVVPEVKTVENKSPELTVPGTKPLKPPSKKSQEASLDALLKQHVKSIKSSFEIRKRKVILKKALA